MREGQRVRRGEVIAYVGTTGRTTGPHVHYEVHRNGVISNPMKYLVDTPGPGWWATRGRERQSVLRHIRTEICHRNARGLPRGVLILLGAACVTRKPSATARSALIVVLHARQESGRRALPPVGGAPVHVNDLDSFCL